MKVRIVGTAVVEGVENESRAMAAVREIFPTLVIVGSAPVDLEGIESWHVHFTQEVEVGGKAEFEEITD